MAWVKYPFHVKHDGVDYEPGEPIEVADAAGHLLRGAAMVDSAPPAKHPPKKRRAKTEA